MEISGLLGVFRFLGSILAGIKGGYDRVRGKTPDMNFEPTDTGIVLRIRNTRPATIIIENVVAKPALLGFSHGDSVEDVANAIISQRGFQRDGALIVLKPEQSETVAAMTFDPFGSSKPNSKVKVVMHWRDAKRGWFSRRRVVQKIAVQDIRELKQASARIRRGKGG